MSVLFTTSTRTRLRPESPVYYTGEQRQRRNRKLATARGSGVKQGWVASGDASAIFSMKKDQITIKVSVTAEDISEGVPEVCSDCPIALALHRAVTKYLNKTVLGRKILGSGLNINVDGDDISVQSVDDDIDLFASIPDGIESDRVLVFVDAFDNLSYETRRLERARSAIFSSRRDDIPFRKEDLKNAEKEMARLKAIVKPFSFTLELFPS
jgi:hypothetical protein